MKKAPQSWLGAYAPEYSGRQSRLPNLRQRGDFYARTAAMSTGRAWSCLAPCTLDLPGCPGKDFRFDPADSIRACRDCRWPVRIMLVAPVDAAARKACQVLDFIAPDKAVAGLQGGCCRCGHALRFQASASKRVCLVSRGSGCSFSPFCWQIQPTFFALAGLKSLACTIRGTPSQCS